MVVSTGRSPILDEVGGPPLEIRHLPAADRQAAYALCHELRVTCRQPRPFRHRRELLAPAAAERLAMSA